MNSSHNSVQALRLSEPSLGFIFAVVFIQCMVYLWSDPWDGTSHSATYEIWSVSHCWFIWLWCALSRKKDICSIWQVVYSTGAFPYGASGKEPACQRRHKRWSFDAWVRKIPWMRAQQPTPVFLPGESHGQRSLVGYSQSAGLQRVGPD